MSVSDPSAGKEAFLSRWSRLKRTAASSAALPVVDTPGATQPDEKANESIAQPRVLPPVESITLETDIGAFLQPQVDPAVRRRALKKLFQDPHFNVMDGLDIYIGDYNAADPLPESLVKELQFARDYIFKDPAQPTPIQPANAQALPAQNAASEAVDAVEPVTQATISNSNCEQMSQFEGSEPDGAKKA